MNQYIAKEFTLTEYENLLKLARNKFDFRKYTDFQFKDNFILWRHDIDISLEQAVVLARIESRYGIQSTFFIHLHNDFYNALDFNSLRLIKELISNGHAIGLHFDIFYYDIQTLNKLEYWLDFEKNILQDLFNYKIEVFSFHNTNNYTMSFEDDMYSGMINTYSNFFKNKIEYCSDSNGFWRYRKLADVLNDPTIIQLQVLTHPEWWTAEEMTPREKIINYAGFKKEAVISNYDRTLKASARTNIR